MSAGALYNARTACLLWLTILLAACGSTPPQPDPGERWGFSGKIGLWAYGKQDSANIDWQDCASDYLIRLSGPLGVGGAVIYGNESGVSLHHGSDTPQRASSPEELLASLGWYMPVSPLRFWLQGQAAPDRPFQRSPLSGGKIQELAQSGWQIRYDYRADRLSRIDMDNGDIRLKWIIREWRETARCQAP